MKEKDTWLFDVIRFCGYGGGHSSSQAKFSWHVNIHCNENPIYVFPEKELRGLSPYFHIHVSVSDLYIPRIAPHISSSTIGRSIVGIYKSLTDTHECGNWDWGRAIPFLGIFVFSVLCLCSVKAKIIQACTVPLSHSPWCILATLLLSRDKWSCQASFRTMEEGGRESIFSSVPHIRFACLVPLFFTFTFLLTLTSTQNFPPSDAFSRFSHVQKLTTVH